METLDKDALYHLFGFFSAGDLCRFGRLNKKLRVMSIASNIWKNRVLKLVPDLKPYDSFDYRLAYITYEKRRAALLEKDAELDLNFLLEKPCHFAALIGDWKLLEPDLGKFDKDEGHISYFDYLILSGLKEQFRSYYSKKPQQPYNVILRALELHQDDFVDWYVAEFDIDVSDEDPENDKVSVMHLAAECDNWAVFEKYSKNRDIYDTDDDGLTVGLRAAKNGSLNFLKKFVEVYGDKILTIADLHGNDLKAIAKTTDIVDWLNERTNTLKL